MIQRFTVENWKLRVVRYPIEDSYSFDGENKIIAVADGVTRDPTEYLPNIKTLSGKLQFALNYPKPSPAKKAADIFTRIFPEVIRDFKERDEKAIKEAFIEANRRIGKWNDHNIKNVDYLVHDFAGCVASGTSEKSGFVHYGYLTDCGIAIFDENGNLRFRTEDEGPTKKDKYIWQDERLQGIDWMNPEARRIVRKNYRNNTIEKHSFGVLTGEESAISYVRIGTQEIKLNENLIVYSDGLEEIIFSNEFASKLRNKDFTGLRRLCENKVSTEGTLVRSISLDPYQEMKARAESNARMREMHEMYGKDMGYC